MEVRRSLITIAIIHIMVFLIGFAFLGRSFELLYLLLLYVGIKGRSRKLTRRGLTLFLLGVTISVFTLINYNDSIVIIVLKSLVYWCSYQIGLSIGSLNERNRTRFDLQVFNFLFCFAFGCWLRYVIDVALSWSTVLKHHRWITDLWTHTETTATIGAGWCIPLACIFYYTLVSKNIPRTLKFVVGVQVLVSFFFNILTGTRTFLLILLMTSILTYVLHYTKGKNDKKNVAKVTGVIISIILICVFMYANNSFGIRDMIQSSTLLMRLSQGELSTSALDSNGRFERIIFAIKNIDKIFWGGSYCERTGNRIHNWIFQCLDLYGVISACMLFVVAINVAKIYFAYIKCNQVTVDTKIIVFATLVTFFAYSMIEPVLTSNNIVMSVFFSVGGILDNKRKDIRHERLY